MFCVHFVYHSQLSHCGSGVVGRGREWSGEVGIEIECVGREFGTTSVARGQLLGCKQCSGRPTFKDLSLAMFKVVQRAATVTVGACPTAHQVVRDHLGQHISAADFPHVRTKVPRLIYQEP